jgi:hypothetical protein
MIESSVILFILMVGAGLYLATRLSKEKDRSNPAAEKARLHASLAWHEQRLQNARAKNWDEHMIASIHAQVTEVQDRLAEIAAAEEPATTRNPAA